MASAAEARLSVHDDTNKGDVERRGSVAGTEKSKWERLWPVIACGAGLFSDGYLNNVRPAKATILHSDNSQPSATPASPLQLQTNVY
jgi:hypothetical protein